MGLFDFLKSNKTQVVRDLNGSFSYMLQENAFGNSQKYLDWSLNNPVLFSIIALRSKMISQMKITHLDSQGNVIENSDVLKLLKQPNYFQSKEDFFFQLAWFLSASGNNYTYKKQLLSNQLPKALYNLLPSEIDFNKVMKINTFVSDDKEFNEIGKKTISYTLDNNTYKLPLNSLIPFYDITNGLTCDSLLESPSRIKSIEKVLQNIDENLKSKNLNLKMSQKYLGVNKNVINGASTPLRPEDKKIIEQTLMSKSLLTTNGDVDVRHLISDLKKLYLDEQFGQDAQTCLLAFGLNNDVLNYFAGGSSTFENQQKGEIRFVQNEIQSTANNILNSIASSLGLIDKNESLVASFDHLPIMQSVMLDKIAVLTELQNTIKIGLENGTITSSEAIEMTKSLRIKLGL
jgi:hypothetical protein